MDAVLGRARQLTKFAAIRLLCALAVDDRPAPIIREPRSDDNGPEAQEASCSGGRLGRPGGLLPWSSGLFPFELAGGMLVIEVWKYGIKHRSCVKL